MIDFVEIVQKYRICLKKTQEERDETPCMYNSSVGNYHNHYLGSSQLASDNYLPISTSIHSSLYGIRTGFGASRVRLAPPSYSAFDVSSLPAVNTGNWHTQYSRRIEANKSFRDYGDGERNLFSTINKRTSSNTLDDHATSSSSTSNSAFLGLQMANDGRSLFFGGSNRSNVDSTGSYWTKRNDFHHQKSAAPIFPSFDIESAQDSPLPAFPDSEDHMEEPPLPPSPEFNVENSLPGLESEENKYINFIPQQDTYFGTSLTEDINSFSSRQTGTSLDQLNSLQSLASEILENIEREQNTQIFTYKL